MTTTHAYRKTECSAIKEQLPSSTLASFLMLLSLALIITLGWGIQTVQSANDITPAHISKELNNPRISGRGSFHWFGLKIYDADLWVGEKGYRPEAPTATKFILNLTYARDLAGEKIAQSSIEEIRKLGFGSPEQQAEWLSKMRVLFPNVREGTQISGVYLPNLSSPGIRFYLDGKPIGEINDGEFALAFFAIWLDERTSAPKLRSQLLSSAKSRVRA